MIKKIVYGLLGCSAWFFTLVGILVLLKSLNMINSNPGGFVGSLIFVIVWTYGSYWVGKNMFKAGNYNFIKKK